MSNRSFFSRTKRLAKPCALTLAVRLFPPSLEDCNRLRPKNTSKNHHHSFLVFLCELLFKKNLLIRSIMLNITVGVYHDVYNKAFGRHLTWFLRTRSRPSVWQTQCCCQVLPQPAPLHLWWCTSLYRCHPAQAEAEIYMKSGSNQDLN